MAGNADTPVLRMNAFMRMCRESGIRATHQRREIFREVARTDEHPDVETIFRRVRKRIPTVSMDTVYRTLSLLEERGLVGRLDLFSGRARFDANADSHHHFICTKCGLVLDFAGERSVELAVPEQVKSWGKVRAVRLQVTGTCAKCLGR